MSNSIVFCIFIKKYRKLKLKAKNNLTKEKVCDIIAKRD